MQNHLDELIQLVSHPAIQSRRGEWRIGDAGNFSGLFFVTEIVSGNVVLLYYPEDDLYGHLKQGIDKAFTWIPKLSDPIQPERGLWGMCLNLTRICHIRVDRWQAWTKVSAKITITDGSDNRYFYGPTPEIAVCKAVIAQEAS